MNNDVSNGALAVIRKAIPLTVPVIASYIPLGMAFGVLLSSQGYGVGWAAFMSAAVYAGSMQFAGVGLLAAPFAPVSAALLTLMINARHLFYGLAMLERWRGKADESDRTKPYRVFALTDETFSLYIANPQPPEGVDARRFEFWVSLMDHCYWVIGSVLGALIGQAFRFDSTGIEFSMTALFLVIFLEQWKSNKGRPSALVGLISAFVCLVIFGDGMFLLAAMVVIITMLILLRRRIAPEDTAA